MNLGFTGHRDCMTSEYDLDNLYKKYSGWTWVHGGAKSGFDLQVRRYIERNGIDFKIYYPNFTLYQPKMAPIMRNFEIVNFSDVMVACWDGRGTGGTHRTIQYSIEAGKNPIYVQCFPVQGLELT